jgi:hypothetical protein
MMSATYSPEDNKLRLYASERLDSDTYGRFKSAGFKWAPKQELFVAPKWSPSREDLLLELCGEIDDEDYSPEERAADRAERFEGYRDKRRGEAGGFADTFESGPKVFGHDSARRAERAAERHDRHRSNAVSQWSKAEYWQQRTAGVISHALHKSSASVRRGRILTLEAELRKIIADYTPADPDKTIMQQEYSYSTGKYLHDGAEVPHVWCGQGRGGRWVAVARLEAIKRGYERWVAHYELRLTYEKAMLANEGGMAAEVEMEPGGWIGKYQIQKVNKSSVTGRVVSVGYLAPTSSYADKDGKPYGADNPRPMTLHHRNIERLGEEAYRPPTDEEREAFKVETKERKAKEKVDKPTAPSLVNPTEADAMRLQAILNAIGEAKHNERYKQEWERKHHEYKPTQILRMTQAQYSAASKGAYTSFETRTLHNAGGIMSRKSSNMWTSDGSAYDKALGNPVCKIRARYCSEWYSPPHIVVITDKPQKTLPLDWEAIAGLPTQEAAA